MDGLEGYTINKLSDITGMDRRGLTRLLEKTEPVETNGRSKLYTIRQVIESIRGPSATAEKARLDKVRADIAELDLAQKKQELIPLDAVLDMLMPLFSNVRTKLIAIPNKAAPIVQACTTKLEIQAALKVAVYEALEELSDTEPMAILGEHATSVAEAAARVDGKPVGRRKTKAKPRS